jgi:hypothetical protein
MVFLHGLIPHVHETEISEAQHQLLHQNQSESLLNIISLFFHECSSESEIAHEFINGNELEIDLNFLFAKSFITVFLQINKTPSPQLEKIHYPSAHFPNSQLYLSAFSTRPPPVA